MASELLKVFQKIDKDRTSIITEFKNKGYPVNNNSSFSSLSTLLNQNMPQYGQLEDVETINGVSYYKNPEDDPEVWTEYKKWPNVKKIFQDIRLIEYEGLNYYPVSLMLFKTDLKDIRIIAESGYASSATLNNNEIITFYTRNNSLISLPSGEFIKPKYENYKIIIDITLKESDKVIGSDGEVYYYIIEYIDTTYKTDYIHSFNYGTGDDIKIKAIVGNPYNWDTSSSSYSTCSINSNSANDIEALFFVNQALSAEEIEGFGRPLLTKMTQLPKLDLSSLVNLKYLYADILEYDLQNDQTSYILKLPPNINTVINTNKYLGSKMSIRSSLIYYKTPSWNLQSADAPSTSGYNQICYTSKLKYLNYNSLEDQLEYGSKSFYCGDNTNGFAKQGVSIFPFLRDPYAVYGCNKLVQTSERIFEGSFINANSIVMTFDTWPANFSNNPQNFLKGLQVNTCIIESLQEFYACYLLESRAIKVLSLPDATVLYTSSFGTGSNGSDIKTKNFIYLKELLLPSVTDIKSSYSSDKVGELKIISRTLTKINLSSLTSTTNPIFFKYCPALITLILGNDWSSTLDLMTCYSLSRESVLDLFNKLKVLSEEDITLGLTITLPSKGGSMITNFTPEELNIARNKGWTVK